MAKVKIYTTPTCHFCKLAKAYFQEKGVQYEEVDVSTNREEAKKMIEMSGQQGVPVIDIDGKIVVGFDKPKLKSLLNL